MCGKKVRVKICAFCERETTLRTRKNYPPCEKKIPSVREKNILRTRKNYSKMQAVCHSVSEKPPPAELILCYLIDRVHSISHIGVQITTEMPL